MSIASYAGASDTGRKRRRNEDSYVIAPPIFAVADGKGGAQAGEIASRLAAVEHVARDDDQPAGVDLLADRAAGKGTRTQDEALLRQSHVL